jgi:hypothetical protein
VLAGTFLEGTATFVADPAHLTADTGSLRKTRELYRRSADPARIVENFAVFDAVVQNLRDGRIAWRDVLTRGFLNSPKDEERFYFVGYEMAKAIERYCGSQCIGKLLEKPPIEFFRLYISLYHDHPEIRWRFAPKTESYLASIDHSLR